MDIVKMIIFVAFQLPTRNMTYSNRARLKILGYQVPLITRISARVCFMFLVGANRDSDSLFYVNCTIYANGERKSRRSEE